MTPQLPYSNNLQINLLSACFNKTSATYKFYWLLSIVQEIELGNISINKKNLFARMISNAWYTVNYFQISYGKQDIIQESIQRISEYSKITIGEKSANVYEKLVSSNEKTIISTLSHFNKQVPHWFLSPWFPKLTNEKDTDREKRIYKESKLFNNNCPYSLYDSFIVINNDWVEYFKLNSKIIKDFCLWNLCLFLQSKNPNVPDIPNKILNSDVRKQLTNQKVKYWDKVINEIGPIICIYTGKLLNIKEYVLDHYIPHNFVSHDLIWNLIPADRTFNIVKSNKLPPMRFFNDFYKLQETAINIIKEIDPSNRYLDEYLTIFPDWNESFTKDRFHDTIQPLITIASNNGFEYIQ